MATLTRYAEERVQLLKRLRMEAGGPALAELFRASAYDVRFRLGTSLADLRIPFKLGGAFRHAADIATIDAYLLAGQRHKQQLAPGEYDRLVLIDGYDASALRALTFTPPSTVTRESMRWVFQDGIEAHAGLDAGLVASFFGTERPGRALALALHTLLAKAREEAGRSDVAEPTPYLVALMLRSAAEASHALTRDAPVGEQMSRFLRAGVGALLHQTVSLALRESGLFRASGLGPALATGSAPPPPRDPREIRSALLAQATLGLTPFLGARGSVVQTGICAYGMLFDTPPPRLEELVTRLARGDDPETLARDFSGVLQRERDLARRLERQAAMAVLRDHLHELARQLETIRGVNLQIPGEGSLERLAISRDGLEKLFASEGRRKELQRVARELARTVPSEAARARLEVLAHAAREFREDEPAAWLGVSDARGRAARALVALAADTWIDRQAATAAGVLMERTGAETEGGETAEYESGRLYYVSHEARPLLNARVGAPQVGHLFCDMKDFTRRTAFLKESVIADFLQREFYAPILQAASGLDPGSHAPSAPRAIALNNLLGDAVSFSGDIVALMKLAREIRDAIRDYGRRLEQEASQDAVSARIRELESQHRIRREAMERSHRELTARAPRSEPAICDAMMLRAREIRSELTRQEALFQAELAHAAGEKLEAGTFLSYGAAPEVARFEDPVFGPIKVAIAEKINESARGTARSGPVRAKVDAQLARARRTSGKPLVLPFAVLVDAPLTIPVPPEQAVLISEHLAHGELAEAERLYLEAARRAVTQPAANGELYNAGAATSEEALRAYLEARGGDYLVARREVRVADLHAQLRERFFFPRPTLELVLCASPATKALAELFVFQGRVQFRGFEATGGLGVYEIIDPTEPLFAMLQTHHAAEWLR